MLPFINGQGVSGPKDLPNFRAWLKTQWTPGAIFDTASRLSSGLMPYHEHQPDRSLSFDRETIGKAGLYYVTAEVVDVVQNAAKTLPPTTLTRDLLPEPSGLIWLEKPLVGISADPDDGTEPGQPLLVVAQLWGNAHLPPGVDALGISSYGLLDLPEGPMFFPLGRTDWLWGHDSEEPTKEWLAGDARRLESMAEDRRFLATLALLMSQPNVTETEELIPPRSTRRRSERAALSSTVRVVNVRSRRPQGESSGSGRQIEWTKRWIVGPHWRQQAYGPGRSLRRPQLILPYVKGPDDKPLVVRETVHLLTGDEPR